MKKLNNYEGEIINLKHYNQVLRRKLKIYQDTVARNQKMIDKLLAEIERLHHIIKEARGRW